VDYVAEADSGSFGVDLGLAVRCFDCMLAGLGTQFPELCRLVTDSLDLIRARVDRTAEDLLYPIQLADNKPESHAGSIPKEFGRWTIAFVRGCKVDPSSFDISVRNASFPERLSNRIYCLARLREGGTRSLRDANYREVHFSSVGFSAQHVGSIDVDSDGAIDRLVDIHRASSCFRAS
jgi:hypothetical protein